MNYQSKLITRRSLITRLGVGAAAALVVPTLSPVNTVFAGSLPARQPQIMWGVYMPPVPFAMKPLYNLEAQVGSGAEIIMYGHPWSNSTDPNTGLPSSYHNFAYNYMEAIWHHGSYPMVGWQPWDTANQSTAGPDTPMWRTAEITSGTYDAYITRFARDAKAWGNPFFLRLAHEMNGPWRFPWCEPNNGNQPGDYVRMWRHVHDIFTRVGVTNVTWVLNPNVHSLNSIPMASLYPGDAYVDWIGLDGYNWGSDADNIWQTFPQVFAATPRTPYGDINSYQEILSIAPGKPLMLCEVASATRGGPNGEASAGDWYRDMLEVQLPTHFPKIRAIVHQNTNYGVPAVCSWPIDTTVGGTAAWKHGLHFREGLYGHNSHGVWTTKGKIRPGTYQPVMDL